jgi:stalled ribosome alternative rescue factor ArfA
MLFAKDRRRPRKGKGSYTHKCIPVARNCLTRAKLWIRRLICLSFIERLSDSA